MFAFVAGAFAFAALVGTFLGIGVLAIVGDALAAVAAVAAGILRPRAGIAGCGRDESYETLADESTALPVADTSVSAPLLEPEKEEDIEPVELPALCDARLLIGFARAIAADVPTMTEKAAFALIDRFENMRENTSKAARSARDFKSSIIEGRGSGHAPVTVQAERTRSVIKAQCDSIAVMTEHNNKGARDLRSMGKDLESGMGLLKGIEEITERSRLIAFNMAVEAARIGEKGRGIRVIVGELRKLNDKTADFSRQVSDLLLRFKDYNESVVARLAEETEKVSMDVQKGMGAAEEAVESLITASGTADRFARDVASLVETIDGDLDGVLESLQFQDITRQMIEGSLAILDEAKGDVEKSLDVLGLLETADSDLARKETIRRALLARSKTRGEKEAIMGVQS